MTDAGVLVVGAGAIGGVAHVSSNRNRGVTAVTDNAALTYLGSQVEGLSEEFKRALVAGAVTGGPASLRVPGALVPQLGGPAVELTWTRSGRRLAVLRARRGRPRLAAGERRTRSCRGGMA